MALASASSQIVFDRISEHGSASVTNPIMFHQVTSSDAVLLVFIAVNNGIISSVTVNGTAIPAVASLTANTIGAQIYYMNNPPVGLLPIQVNGTILQVNVITMTLLGADKVILIPITNTNSSTSGSISTPIQAAAANSLLIDMVASGSTGTPQPANSEQTRLSAMNTASGTNSYMSYMIASPGVQNMAWSPGGIPNLTQAIIAIEPAHAPSIWFPNIDFRSVNDVVGQNNLQGAAIPASVQSVFGNFPATFWQNSFLHTVGRILPGAAPAPTLVAETELETSQVVIDKITQQAAASATSLTSDHVVSSQDAVMLIFASQMGVAQGLNSVNLNGVALNALGNPSISTLAAGAYFVVNPPVGINTISSNVTLPTALELVVMTFLGVDKKNVNPIFVSNSALTGSPSSSIAPTAANSLIIDFVSSLGTSIGEDASQTVYLDQPQTASQAAGSIKLSTVGNQTMNWTTLSTAWVQLAVALEPANALSIWFPAIDFRNLSDVIAVYGLDDHVNPIGSFFGAYGAYPSTFYQNSFLHTIGRMPHGVVTPPVSTETSEYMLLGVGS